VLRPNWRVQSRQTIPQHRKQIHGNCLGTGGARKRAPIVSTGKSWHLLIRYSASITLPARRQPESIQSPTYARSTQELLQIQDHARRSLVEQDALVPHMSVPPQVWFRRLRAVGFKNQARVPEEPAAEHCLAALRISDYNEELMILYLSSCMTKCDASFCYLWSKQRPALRSRS
jgi:hypothetical protein